MNKEVRSRWLNLALIQWTNSRAYANKLVVNMKSTMLIKTLCSFALIFCALPSHTDESLFEIGKFSTDPKTEIPSLEPMANHLAELMQQFGIEDGHAQVFVNIEQVRQSIRNGDLDMITCGIYEAARLVRSGDATPIAVKWMRELPEYSSLIVVSRDSGVEDISDLVGKSLGFEDAQSSSAFFIPYQTIIDSGLPLVESTNLEQTADNIYYQFTGSTQSSLTLLIQKKIDAIAISDLNWLQPNYITEQQRENFRVIWMSKPIPYALELVQSAMPENQRIYLTDQLMRMHLDPGATDTLSSYHNATRFSPLQLDDLNNLGELVGFLARQEISP